jgi:hypothetical protein
MSAVNRRAFLVSLTTTPFAASMFEKEPPLIVRIESASTFYAPHLQGQLRPGTPLDVEVRAGSPLLRFGGLIVGRLPRLAAELLRKNKGVVRVSEIDRDADGRLRISVEIKR